MDEPIRIFLGYDKREAVGFHVCVQSIIERASIPVSITPIFGERRDGTNDFIYARFLVPYLCGFKGWALFADGADMLFREDVAELWKLRPSMKSVSVVQREYSTRAPRKYLGTEMEADNRDYPRKNWSSLMLFNCSHYSNRVLTPAYVSARSGSELHRFAWLAVCDIEALPEKWNVLIGEDGDDGECAIAHFTLGIPAMQAYRDGPYAREWWDTFHRMQRTW